MQDYVLNGVGYGPVGQALTQVRDPGFLRPFIEDDPNSPDRGRRCAVAMTQNANTGLWDVPKKRTVEDWERQGAYSPAFNSTMYTRSDWVRIDEAVVRATRQELTAWSDLMAANRYGDFDAWAHMTLEYPTLTDVGEVVKDMDATAPARNDTPAYGLRSIPLPVIHFDCSFPQRLLDNTRRAGRPLDTTVVEQGTRRFWESVEKTTIGTETGVTYGTRSTGPFPHTGTSTEYGYTNFPYRVTKTDLNTPTGTNPEAVVQDVLEAVETMRSNGYGGPFVLYHSTPYSIWLDSDYFRSGSTSAVRTLRERVMQVDGVSAIRRLNWLTSGYQLILVDLNQGQFQAIDGMRPRTIQFSERGGLLQKLIVLGIQVPLLKAPPNGVSAVIHATTS